MVAENMRDPGELMSYFLVSKSIAADKSCTMINLFIMACHIWWSHCSETPKCSSARYLGVAGWSHISNIKVSLSRIHTSINSIWRSIDSLYPYFTCCICRVSFFSLFKLARKVESVSQKMDKREAEKQRFKLHHLQFPLILWFRNFIVGYWWKPFRWKLESSSRRNTRLTIIRTRNLI